jgi:hypothetical protein
MEINSQEVCSQCKDLERCVTTAVFNPRTQIRCIHFGYINKASEDYMKKVQDEIIKIKNSLITYPEEN